MTTITHRVGNTRNLTPSEVDANFDRLSADVELLKAGGVPGASFPGLADAATAPIPTTNAPTAAALALKAPLNNPTFTGTVGGVTKSAVGLGNVDNTSDVNKPVSTAQAAADALKAPLASPTFTGTVSGITATMVGLGNVNNTSDLAKPISTLTAAALALKQPTLIAGTGITI